MIGVRTCALRRWLLVAVLAAFPTVGTAPAIAAPTADALRDPHPCATAAGFTCSTLRVPLDPSGRVRGTLDLAVAAAGNVHAARGVLLVLTGGPGQPGLPYVADLAQKLAPVLPDYRLVMLDQRGTGAGALICPQLQEQVGGSDLTVPTAAAVRGCARRIGPHRRFYATADTVADLDRLRRALGVRRWTVDGVSYGTFVAERYALAHPHRVTRLVLDSVVPQTGVDQFLRVPQRASGRVLRTACAAIGCSTDPVTDLAAVVRARHDGPQLLDAVIFYGFVDPDYTKLIDVLHSAASGRTEGLDRLLVQLRPYEAATPQDLSQGLHASTLCADGRWPWGTAAAPLAGRARAVHAAALRLRRDDVYPFTRATALGNGELQTCRRWPRTPVVPVRHVRQHLPAVPTLLLGGDRDLSTPLEWLEQERRYVPCAHVVVVRGAGHSIQNRAVSDSGRRAVWRFLLTTGSRRR